VLDQHDGQGLAVDQGQDRIGQRLRLLLVQARQRLVEQKDFGP
jgi:hypothetical protein